MICNSNLNQAILLAIVAVFQVAVVEPCRVMLHQENWTEIKLENLIPDKTTIGSFREIIGSKLGMNPARVRLITSYGYPLLDDEEFICEESDRLLSLRLQDDLTDPGTIEVNFGWKRIPIVATKDKTLGWLKSEVTKASGSNEYRCFYYGEELIDISKTLAEYKFFKGAEIAIFGDKEKYKVEVYPSEGRFVIVKTHVTIGTTVKDLKELIKTRNVDLTGKFLIYHDDPLEDDRTLFSYSHKFYRGMTIHLVDRVGKSGGVLEMLYQKKDFRMHFPVYVIPNNTVADLKKYTYKMEKSIPIDRMKLIFRGRVIGDDSVKLSDLDIYSGGWIQVTFDESIVSGTSEATRSDDRMVITGDAQKNQNVHSDTPETLSNSPEKPINLESSSTMKEDSGNECWICYDEMSDEEPNVITDCGHMFHQKCLIQWRDNADHNEPICPTCRCKLTNRCYQPIIKLPQ